MNSHSRGELPRAVDLTAADKLGAAGEARVYVADQGAGAQDSQTTGGPFIQSAAGQRSAEEVMKNG